MSSSVLVVDDDPIALEVARNRLERLGYEVTVREQALGTSQWIASHTPDYILLDVMMPALSGETLGSFLQRRGLPAQVILHSSRAAEELATLAERIGAVGYIPKGETDDQFSDRFQTIVGRTSHQ